MQGRVAKGGGGAFLQRKCYKRIKQITSYSTRHLCPSAPGRFKVHASHLTVCKHFEPLQHSQVDSAATRYMSHVTCIPCGRSSSASSAPQPPTVSDKVEGTNKFGFRLLADVPVAVFLPPTGFPEAAAEEPPTAIDCHAGAAACFVSA